MERNGLRNGHQMFLPQDREGKNLLECRLVGVPLGVGAEVGAKLYSCVQALCLEAILLVEAEDKHGLRQARNARVRPGRFGDPVPNQGQPKNGSFRCPLGLGGQWSNRAMRSC